MSIRATLWLLAVGFVTVAAVEAASSEETIGRTFVIKDFEGQNLKDVRGLYGHGFLRIRPGIALDQGDKGRNHR